VIEMKGVSPLIASVLLIAITLAVAAVLANYLNTFTTQTLENLPMCSVGGSVSFVSADYPKWDSATSTIVAIVEARSVALGKFKFVVTLNDDTVFTYEDVTGHSISAGSIGDIRTGPLTFDKSDVKNVIITTNCSNIKAGPTTLR
jgi:flagellin-like protein